MVVFYEFIDYEAELGKLKSQHRTTDFEKEVIHEDDMRPINVSNIVFKSITLN